MDNNSNNFNTNNQFINDIAKAPEKPQFLKVLCILSFVACSLLILIYACGAFCLTLSAETVNSLWDKVIASQPQLAEMDPTVFFHEVGLVCVYSLLSNIASLVGVILMWRLNKIGFFIYAVAELASNFFGAGMNFNGAETKSYGGLIFWIVVDIVFIIMYFLNLKHMNKPQNVNV